LDSGWLSGRYDATSRFQGIRARWTAEQIAQRADLVSQLQWLTADGTPLALQALAFVLSYDVVGCVIPGIRNAEQLQNDIEAAGRSLSLRDRTRLEEFWDMFTRNGQELLAW
jgi:aryl-alcohol dehydrogenase-like predicted oxidoreductase